MSLHSEDLTRSVTLTAGQAAKVPKGIERAVRSWLRSQREFHLPKERKAAECWGVRP
jgi:hypothetical protein